MKAILKHRDSRIVQGMLHAVADRCHFQELFQRHLLYCSSRRQRHTISPVDIYPVHSYCFTRDNGKCCLASGNVQLVSTVIFQYLSAHCTWNGVYNRMVRILSHDSRFTV